MAGGLLSTITVRQAVLADLEVIAELFNQYRQFQGKAAGFMEVGRMPRALKMGPNYYDELIMLRADESR